jgi:hypothetical protein
MSPRLVLRIPLLAITTVCTSDQLIADMSAGDWATVTPDEGETKPTTRNRLKAASARRGLSIVFQRTRDLTVVFHLEQIEE